MLQFTRWKAIATVVTTLILCMLVLPTVLPPAWSGALPGFLQRRMTLGLDLQGGVHLLLEVDAGDVLKEKLRQTLEDARRVLNENPRIGYIGLATRGALVEVRIRQPNEVPEALRRLRGLASQIGGVLTGTGQVDLQVTDAGGGLIQLTPTQAGINDRVRQALDQSIEIVRRRVDQLGTVEPLIQRQGANRILVQVPGLQDPERLKKLIGDTAKLEFRLVDQSVDPQEAERNRPPPDAEVLKGRDGQLYVVQRQVMVAGEDLVDARPGFDDRTREPVVNFRFNARGARRFGAVTSANVGRPFAIILDGQVISAPVIREPITQGSGQISGGFTVQGANDLAILLRAGALPAKLEVKEERTVGAGLGRDSIEAGKLAAIVGSALVVVYMVATYGLFGWFANIAVLANVAMIFGILSVMEATLTLPGIAGIVLTVGMAVDSNVVIYERIREEVRNGRSAITALDAGFNEALRTILDANVTSLIAGIVLFFIGTGPVRGFALTLSIGIFTTMFTAFTLTRLIVAEWVRWKRPTSIPM